MKERELFLAALEIEDPAARQAHLQTECADDAELLARVESLLTSHEGQSQFLNTPVVEQIADAPDTGAAATLLYGSGSTQDEEPDATTISLHGLDAMTENEDDEIPLGYLQPSSKPGSMGRLGHYEIHEVLGRGAFGTVLKAFDEKLHRVVAIKVLAPEMAATSPARKRFIREAQASAAIRHEHVVSIYAVEEKPIPYLVMEYIPGLTLQQRLDERGPLDVLSVLRLGRQMAEGLEAAHAQGLIHRDIKPGNILLETSVHDRVKITDFGLARAADDASLTQSGTIAGTPMYMAPEQALGHKLDQRADLFSLGSVLYQMVSGRPPFRAASTLAVLKRVTEETPRPIGEIIPETPQWLCDIITKLHAKNPDERYQSAREVTDVLANCESQLKEHSQLKDLSLIPRAKSQPAGWWKVVAVVALMCPLLAFGVYVLSRPAAPLKVAGNETKQPPHELRQPSSEVAENGTIEPATSDTIKLSSDPTPVVVAIQEPLPPTITNSIGMEFVIVPKGKSWLGGGKDRLGDKEVEIPADFYLGKYEVTQEEWVKVMGENPSHFSRTGRIKDAVKDISDADLKRFPVEMVSWDQCQVFVAKLNQMQKEMGWVYRLPTEVEWEYAYRGGPMQDKVDSAFDFYFDKPTNSLSLKDANFDFGRGVNRTCKVGAYAPTSLGLFDMQGNVCELCDDVLVDASGLQKRVVRGIGWNASLAYYRTVPRGIGAPSFQRSTHGLRLARVPAGAPSPEPKTPLVTGRFALAFDGEKSVVRIPSLRIPEDHALTVETWAVLAQPAVLVQPVHQTGGRDLIGNPSSAGFVLNVSVGYGGDGKKLAFMIRLKNPDTYAVAREKQPVPRNQLIHLAGVYDGSAEIRFYVNGQLQSRAPAQDIKPSTRQLTLGNNSEGTSGFLGRMNEVRISKVARYDADFTPAQRWEPDTDTIALYHFDEGEGTSLKDYSGNRHHGQIVGAKWVQADGSPIGTPPALTPEPLPPTFKNSIGMEFVIVPKGKSWIGGSKDKLGDQEVKFPADFYLGKYEVTQEEWEKVMGEKPSHFSRTGEGKGAVEDLPDADLMRFPVESVSWDRCQIFVTKLNALAREAGWVYRLPTEVEWEYACRGGPMSVPDKLDSAFEFYFAKPTNTLFPEQANFGRDKGLNRTSKVGAGEPNRLGLFEIHGNVWEWCEDILKANDGVSLRVCRGGAWDCDAGGCGAAVRNTGLPSGGTTLGLRLARVPSGAPSPAATTSPVVAPFTDADVRRIAALPAAEQVEEVRKELMRRNPGFDGKVEHKIENDVVTELRVVTDQVTDIAPIRAFNALRVLSCEATFGLKPGNQLADLASLRGMNVAGLTRLYLGNTRVGDAGLANFKGCKSLIALHLGRTQVSDTGLAHFEGCKDLMDLNLIATRVSDEGMAHFKGCKSLVKLHLDSTQVSDAGLVHFKDCKALTVLSLPGTQVSDAGLGYFKECENLTVLGLHFTQVTDAGLAHFQNCKKLTRLDITRTKVTDLSLLKEMPLKELDCTFRPERDGEILRSIKTLEKINGTPAAEFWKDTDQQQAAGQAWLKRIAALPAAEQVEEVRKELKRRNPGFDGTAEHKIEDGVVTELKLITDEIIDIAPVRALQGLVSLNLTATPLPGKRGKLSDISPLRGLPLTRLDLTSTQVTDIEVMREMPLKHLSLDRVPVTDLSPLTGKVLKSLHVGGTKVQSLSEIPIASSEVLHCHLPQISDKSELQRWGVRFLDLWGVPLTVDPDRLRELKPPLSRVNGKPLEEFLKDVSQTKAD